jgi:hypothetical protein
MNFFMNLENKRRKTQLEIDLIIWAEVKRFATLNGVSINAAAEPSFREVTWYHEFCV